MISHVGGWEIFELIMFPIMMIPILELKYVTKQNKSPENILIEVTKQLPSLILYINE